MFSVNDDPSVRLPATHHVYTPNWLSKSRGEENTPNNQLTQTLPTNETAFQADISQPCLKSFEQDYPGVYNAVWKEGYFAASLDLYAMRGPKYSCSECNEIFVTKLSIFTHSQIHKKFFCIMCLAYCESQYEMNKHLTAYHADFVRLTPADITATSIPVDLSSQVRPVTCGDVTLEAKHKRKLTGRGRIMPARKKIEFVEIKMAEEIATKRVLKSRFGRCITVKFPK